MTNHDDDIDDCLSVDYHATYVYAADAACRYADDATIPFSPRYARLP